MLRFGLLACLLLALSAPPPVSVSFYNAPDNLLVPGVTAFARGEEWLPPEEPEILDWGGQPSLAGYTVFLGAERCQVTAVSRDAIGFVVPAMAPGAYAATVSGPVGAFSIPVTVAASHPMLLEQDGFVIATSAHAMFPALYIGGQAIPVDPARFNYIALRVVGAPAEAAELRLTGREQYVIPARVYASSNYWESWNVLFFAPSCANGDYQATLRVAGVESAPAVIRFRSDCQPVLFNVDGGFARPPVTRQKGVQ